MFGFADEGVLELGLVVVVGFDDGLEHGGDFFGADAVGAGFAGARFDDLAEGDGAAHGVGGVLDFAADAVFAEGFPAADDAGGVVDFELVVVVGEEFLEAVADVLAVDGEDDDFVVGEEAEVDGFGEGDDVELFPEEVGVVHGAEGDVVAFGGGLGEGVVDARGGGHVEAPGGAEEVGVVDADEVAFGLVVEGGAGGAVGFVADDEVEGGEAVEVLGFAEDLDGVVGGEDHAHVAGIVALLHLGGEAFGVGGGGIAEFVHEGGDHVFVAFALFADFVVGADGEGVEGGGTFLGPFGEGLGEEGEAGDEKDDAFAGSGEFFGDFEGGEGFASAAGHDEFAAVGGFEAAEDGVFGGGLVGTEGFLCFEDGRGAGLEAGPVDLAVFEVVEIDFGDGRLLSGEGLLGVVGPGGGGGDDDAMGEGFLTGGGEEAVDVAFLDAVVFGVEFALDSVGFGGAAGTGNEVDAGVFGGEAVFAGPVGVGPDLFVEVGVGGLVAEVGEDEFLEIGAFFAFGEGGGAVGVEELLQG